jgi:hypothetical protein
MESPNRAVIPAGAIILARGIGGIAGNEASHSCNTFVVVSYCDAPHKIAGRDAFLASALQNASSGSA